MKRYTVDLTLKCIFGTALSPLNGGFHQHLADLPPVFAIHTPRALRKRVPGVKEDDLVAECMLNDVKRKDPLTGIRTGRQPLGLLPLQSRCMSRWLLARGSLTEHAAAPELGWLDRLEERHVEMD